MKNILLTNDDGLDFIGLRALKSELEKYYSVYVFAPATEQSGTSCALHIHDNIYVKKIQEKEFMVEGFPVDCVNVGIFSGLMDQKIDLVVSGINKGVNMGDDIYYSGTLGACRHATIHNIPSIGVSSGYLDKNGNFGDIAEFVRGFIQNHADRIQPNLFININYPATKSIRGIKITKPGKRIYVDSYKRYKLTGSSWFLNLGGSHLGYVPEPGTDFEAYEEGYISISPVTMNKYENRDISDWEKITGV